MRIAPSARHATIAVLALCAAHAGCGASGASGNGLPSSSGTGSSTSGNGGTSGSAGIVGSGGVGDGGTVGAAGVTGSGGAAGTGAPVGSLFEQYSLLGADTSDGATYSSNGVLASSTYYFYVENTGGSGAATVTVSYQGYTETNNFTVEGGTQYVLASRFAGGNGTTTSCVLSAELPGLTLERNFAETDALASNFGKCTKVAGNSTSELIPLSSCTCSGGCPAGKTTCANNCGFADAQCCGGCPAGKTCQSGHCL